MAKHAAPGPAAERAIGSDPMLDQPPSLHQACYHLIAGEADGPDHSHRGTASSCRHRDGVAGCSASAEVKAGALSWNTP